MTITPPLYQSQLAKPVTVQNFLAVQSAVLTVSNAGASGSQRVIFTDIPGTVRINAKITNSSSKGCYLSSNTTSNSVAVVSTGTPTPTSGIGAVATCDYIAAGSIQTLDFVQGTNNFSAICAGTDTATLEISMGYGQ